MKSLLALVNDSIDDNVLSTAEKRSLTSQLREADLRGDQLRQVRNHAFKLVQDRARDPEQHQSMPALINWLSGIVKTLDKVQMKVAVRSQVWFSPGDECRNALINHLNSAKKQVDVCVFTIADDRITAAIIEAHKRDVSVRIISDNNKSFDTGSDIAQMRDFGIPMALDESRAHMHHKFAIFDGTRVLNGSFNWTRSASRYNEENIVSTTDPNQIEHFQEQFDELWERFS